MKISNDIFSLWQTISWTAIFSAVLTGFGINFLLNLTTLAFGLSIFSLDEGRLVFSYIGFVVFAIISFITMFITGWIAGHFSPPVFTRTIWGALIGFIAWSLLLIVTVVIIMNMIQFVSFHSNFTSHPQLVAIRISNNEPMMTETTSLKNLNPPLDIDIEKTTKVITINAYVTLLLFLLGACSSCAGGYFGYRRQNLNFLIKKK